MKIANSNSVLMLAIWTGLFGPLAMGIASEPMSKPLIDLQNPLVAEQWISVNDNVMGGISEGG